MEDPLRWLFAHTAGTISRFSLYVSLQRGHLVAERRLDLTDVWNGNGLAGPTPDPAVATPALPKRERRRLSTAAVIHSFAGMSTRVEGMGIASNMLRVVRKRHREGCAAVA